MQDVTWPSSSQQWGLKNDFRNFDHWHGEDICQLWMYMVHLWVIAVFFLDTNCNGCNGADTKASHGFKSRIVLYSTKPLLSKRCTTRRPNRTFLLVWSAHHTRMDQLGRKFCVKTSDDYFHLFLVCSRCSFQRTWKGEGRSRYLFHCFTFFLRSLDIFALNQALGPAGVLLTRGEDGNAILIRLRLWTSRE